MSDSTPQEVHPYYQAILDAYASAGRPYYHQVSAPEAREMLRTSLAAAPPQANLPELASVTDDCVSHTGGDIAVRRYRPLGEVQGVCVYMHAGGWVIGDLDTGDALCRRLAAGAGCEVVSVDYRLAPEYPFPAPLEDTYTVLQWADKLTAGPLVVAGESAGGNLAAAAAIRARRDNGPRVAGQFLAYPVTDHDFNTASYREVGALNYLLSEADMRWFWDHYCPQGVDRNDPLVAPLHCDTPGELPPTLLYTAGLDPLREEGLAYARLLEEAGVAVETRCDPGMLHGYLSAAASVPLAAEAVQQAAQWIKQRIAEAGT